jgi:hypothetical protein
MGIAKLYLPRIKGDNTMKVSIINKLGIVLTVICSVFALSSVPAEAACTSINSLPRAINVPGCYTLSGDLTTAIASGYGINIVASNVLLDMGGYSITNTNDANSEGVFGIHASGVSNITIKNGSIVNFHGGIQLDTSDSSIVIDNIRIDFKTAGRNGGDIYGTNITVSNCRIHGNPSVTAHAGITGAGPNTRYINNVISDINGAASFDIPSGGSLVMDNNMVLNSTLMSGAGISVVGDGVVLTRNIVVNKATGLETWGPTSGIYRDNLVTGCTTSYNLPSTMVNAGNNQ